MNFIEDHLITLILFSPLVASMVILLVPKDRVKLIRWLALIFSLVPLAFALYLWFAYDSSQPGFQFQEQIVWYEPLRSSYHVGVDGISVSMVLLTTLLTPLALLISWSITQEVRAIMALFLFLETGMLGVFVVLDLLLFFVFWEIGLVPMYFIINRWGSANKEYASFKFMIVTIAGSIGLLLAIQLIGISMGTFDLLEIMELWPSFDAPFRLLGLPIMLSTSTVKAIAFWAMVIAFAIKIPIFPFHTWLPDAHTEAPTGGSMILAGVLLKLGAYGFLRLILPLYPEEAKTYALVLGIAGVISIIHGAFTAWGQSDFKRLVAYSSVNHMGFVVLGIAVAAYATGTASSEDAVTAMNGSVLQMFNHGLSAAGMFLLVGVIYERTHTRDMNAFGGLFPLMPIYGGILIFTSMASLGLPGLNGFVSEVLVVVGAWPVFKVLTALSMLGVLITGAYILKGIGKVLHGPLNEKWVGHNLEIGLREALAIAPLMILMLLLGIWPSWLLDVINETVMRLIG
ncbi:MAG: NADH-quinone oxidoreductase subunit M [Anaerolineales bacterium]|nr:NADH-quinone oxidoreductase subunit M [Anaerolineales bacterium]